MSTGLVVGHAIFGEKNRGHDLLAASPGAAGAERLSARMDLRGSPPPYTSWSPYFSGFRDGTTYVLARTAPDPDAPRQMVFSRALLVPIDAIMGEQSISGMLRLLEELGGVRGTPEDLQWVDGEPHAASSPLADALSTRGRHPVVWPGQAGFAEAIAGLWRNLWPSARASLSFRLAFSPQDVAVDTPDIVCAPEGLETRWSGFRIVGRPETSVNEVAAGLLTGKADIAVREVLEDLSSDGVALGDLAALADTAMAACKGTELPDLLDAMRLVARLAPNPNTGANTKATLIARAEAALRGSSCREIRMARNLDLGAFINPAPFWSGLKLWAATDLWREQEGSLLATTIIESASAGTHAPVAGWRGAIADGADQALTTPNDFVLAGIWRGLTKRAELLSILTRSNRKSALDKSLAANAPESVEARAALDIRSAAAKIGMPSLHGVLCALALAPTEAINRHVTEVSATAASLRLAAAEAKAGEIVAAALRNEVQVLTEFAASEVAASPELLAEFDPTDAKWRRLWTMTLARNRGAWSGPKTPAGAMHQLLIALLDGDDVDELIVALGDTPLADASAFERRPELWRRLPPPARASYLAASANGWIEAVSGGGDGGLVEDDLATVICQPLRLDPLLERGLVEPVVACTAFRSLPHLVEADFRRWLARLIRRAERADQDGAGAIGRLIAARSWNGAASDIADAVASGRHDDFRPALSYVKDMLGFLTKWRLGILGESPSDAEKWRVLEEIGVELYGYGPGAENLWTRAGGKEADIPNASNGREAWRTVISAAERGKALVDIESLIETMRSDHPNNWAVNKMRWDTLFRSGR